MLDSPDNLAYSASIWQVSTAHLHNAYEVGNPKMPGEPPRVQPSRKVAANWENGTTTGPAV
jgi:hypothetical protein